MPEVFGEVHGIQSWQRDKSLVLDCDMKKGAERRSEVESHGGKKGHALVKVTDGGYGRTDRQTDSRREGRDRNTKRHQ